MKSLSQGRTRMLREYRVARNFPRVMGQSDRRKKWKMRDCPITRNYLFYLIIYSRQCITISKTQIMIPYYPTKWFGRMESHSGTLGTPPPAVTQSLISACTTLDTRSCRRSVYVYCFQSMSQVSEIRPCQISLT